MFLPCLLLHRIPKPPKFHHQLWTKSLSNSCSWSLNIYWGLLEIKLINIVLYDKYQVGITAKIFIKLIKNMGFAGRFLNLFYCIWVLVYTTYLWNLQKPEEGIRSFETGLTNGYQSQRECCELNHGPLEEEQALLNTEPSPATSNHVLK